MLNSSDIILLFDLLKKSDCEELRNIDCCIQDEFILKNGQEKYFKELIKKIKND